MRTNLHPWNRVLVLLALVSATTIGVVAQSQANSGNIEGRVVDPNGAALPPVLVTATNQETGFSKSVGSDSDGAYRIILLPPGKYTVNTRPPTGFKSAPYTNVTVTVGALTPLDIQLTLGGADTVTVDVSAVGEIVETTRTSVSTTINQKSIDNLPINGRNF